MAGNYSQWWSISLLSSRSSTQGDGLLSGIMRWCSRQKPNPSGIHWELRRPCPNWWHDMRGKVRFQIVPAPVPVAETSGQRRKMTPIIWLQFFATWGHLSQAMVLRLFWMSNQTLFPGGMYRVRREVFCLWSQPFQRQHCAIRQRIPHPQEWRPLSDRNFRSTVWHGLLPEAKNWCLWKRWYHLPGQWSLSSYLPAGKPSGSAQESVAVDHVIGIGLWRWNSMVMLAHLLMLK